MPGQYLVADGFTKPFSRPRIPKLVDATITINVEETPKVLKAHSGYTIQREVEGWKVVVQASGLGNFAGSVERAIMGKIKGSIDSGSGSSEEKAEEKSLCQEFVPWEASTSWCCSWPSSSSVGTPAGILYRQFDLPQPHSDRGRNFWCEDQSVSTLQLDLIDGCKRLLDWWFEPTARIERRREFRPQHRSCPVELWEIHSSFSWPHDWYLCGSTSTFRRARWLECWTNLDQRLSVARVHSVCAFLKTVIEINNLSTLCLESSSRMWSQLRRERPHFGNTPRWKLRSGIKSRCWERSFKRLSKRVTSCTCKQLSMWRCHNVTINLNIVNNAGGTSTVQHGNQTPVVGSATDSDFEFVTPWSPLCEPRAGSLDIELYLWPSDASFGISLESARPYLFWWCGRMSQGECESSHSFRFSKRSVSSDIDARWQLLVNCRTPWTRVVKHARAKAYLAQKGVPRNAVSIELASQKKPGNSWWIFLKIFVKRQGTLGIYQAKVVSKMACALDLHPTQDARTTKRFGGRSNLCFFGVATPCF